MLGKMRTAGLGTRATGGWQDVARDFGIASEADDGFAAIATQIVGRGDDTSKSSRDRCAVELGQHRVSGGAGSVAGDQNRDLLSGQAAFACLPATLA
jgi:hypothetical protein